MNSKISITSQTKQQHELCIKRCRDSTELGSELISIAISDIQPGKIEHWLASVVSARNSIRDFNDCLFAEKDATQAAERSAREEANRSNKVAYEKKTKEFESIQDVVDRVQSGPAKNLGVSLGKLKGIDKRSFLEGDEDLNEASTKTPFQLAKKKTETIPSDLGDRSLNAFLWTSISSGIGIWVSLLSFVPSLITGAAIGGVITAVYRNMHVSKIQEFKKAAASELNKQRQSYHAEQETIANSLNKRITQIASNYTAVCEFISGHVREADNKLSKQFAQVEPVVNEWRDANAPVTKSVRGYRKQANIAVEERALMPAGVRFGSVRGCTRKAEPHAETSKREPSFSKFQIPVERIGDVTGKDGGAIRAISEETGAKIEIDDQGTVRIESVDQSAAQKARLQVEELLAEVEVGKVYEGKVVKLMDFGAFVNILPDRDGLVHISQISHDRVEDVGDVLSVGDVVTVKVLEVDKQGRIRLSMKELGDTNPVPALNPSEDVPEPEVPMPKRSALDLDGKLKGLEVPWIFDYPCRDNYVFSCTSQRMAQAITHISTSIVQILLNHQAGKIRFLFIDPVGLGNNFSFFHALADYDEKLITDRVWSDRRHIQEQLDKLVQHIEGVVHKYLRADFESIDDYNEAAGEIAEAYRFVYVFGFPTNFDAESCLALERIMANGPRCGVHVILVQDQSVELPHGVAEEVFLKAASVYVSSSRDEVFYFTNSEYEDLLTYMLDPLPDAGLIKDIVEQHGRDAKAAANVEIPYPDLMRRFQDEIEKEPETSDEWCGVSDLDSLVGPLGPSGAKHIQKLILGEPGTTAHHALIVGKTGSGKSNLLHVFILGLAELYSPEDLSMYLIDFKRGVEFKDYARFKLPHGRVVAIEGDLEFGVSVLRGIDSETKERGETFRQSGVSNLTDYRNKTGKRMPRIVIIIDEFHELFTQESALSREAMSIIERVVRQGRGFGIHLILASQSISGVTIPRAILEQIGIRIAMQCSDADSRLVLGEDNNAARLLERAGDAIYNDRNGEMEGNSNFQAALLSPEVRAERLEAIREKALQTFPRNHQIADGPVVFEGSEPARFEHCRPFMDTLANWPPAQPVGAPTIWVGEPISLNPAHGVPLKPQGGANMLVVDRNEELAFGVVVSAMLSLCVQETPETVALHFVDLSSADSYWAEHSDELRKQLPFQIELYTRRDFPDVGRSLMDEVQERENSDGTPSRRIVLVVFGLQRIRELRTETSVAFGDDSDEPSLHDQLQMILRQGPPNYVHTWLWCDSLQNADRALGNENLNEIGHRIAGGLTSGDSMKFFDDPIASRIEKDNRMICYDDDRVGVYVPIRPYSPCELEWLQNIGAEIRNRRKTTQQSESV